MEMYGMRFCPFKRKKYGLSAMRMPCGKAFFSDSRKNKSARCLNYSGTKSHSGKRLYSL